MKQKFIFAALIAITMLSLAPVLSRPIAAQTPPENRAQVDITIDDAGNLTIGGIQLAALGVAPVDPQVATMAKNLGELNVSVQDDALAVNVQDTEIARLLWNEASREASARLAANYGVQLLPAVQDRVQQWVGSSNIDVTARYSNDGSFPAQVSLSKPIIVDIAENGQLSVEGGPLATGIQPYALQQIRMGGAQALACWDQGTLTTTVDGVELPTLVVNPAGVNIIAQALGLPINQAGTDAILDATVGVDLSLPGGSHVSDAACAN